MATQPLTSAQFDSQISSLQSQEEKARTKLEATPGYYSDAAAPSFSAVAQDVTLRGIQAAREKLQSKQKALDWYGPGGQEDMMPGKPREGFFMGALNSLAKPLQSVVGASKWALGKSPGKNIFESADQSMKDREYFGDLLRQFDVPAPIAAPVGFAMDVIFDPVNILTLGTGSFVGKIGYGVAKAGLEGATTGFKSSFLNAFKHVTNFVPEFAGWSGRKDVMKVAEELLLRGVKETDPEYINLFKNALNPANTITGRIREVAVKTSSKINKFKTAVRTGAEVAETKYGEITGNTIERILEERAARLTVGEAARELINKIPGGEKFLRGFDYNPQKWQQLAMFYDKVMNVIRQNELTIEQALDPATGLFTGKNLSTAQVRAFLDSVRDLSTKIPDDVTLMVGKDKKGIADWITKVLEEGAELANAGKGVTRGSGIAENTSRMLGEVATEKAWNNLQSLVKELSGNVTGVNSFDRSMAKVYNFKVRNVEVGKKIIDTYAKFIGLFKASKLGPLSPASMVNAVVGNLTMTHMAGIDITRPEVYKRARQALDYLRGKDIDTVGKILANDSFIRGFSADFSTTFSRSLGFSAADVQAKNAADFALQRLTKEGTLLGKYDSEQTKHEVEEIFREAFEESALTREQIKRSATPFERAWKEGMPNGPALSAEQISQRRYEKMAGGSVAPLANELSTKPFLEMRQRIAEKAAGKGLKSLLNPETDNKLAIAMNWALDQTKHYELVDQSARLGNFLYLTQDGLSAGELRHMTGWTGFGMQVGGMRISPADITSTITKGGSKFYKIHPAKALEISNEIYMNYNAMPAAVKVLRALPVFGMPFVAFAYAMALKTGKTALTNPAAFNKINFFLEEIEKHKSPLEKQGLNSKYYSWYNKPGMINLPLGPLGKFFDDNPIYMNVSSMIPYYSMNMFMPSERKYEEGWNGALASSIDKVPFLKDPIGQMITDYFIIPNIIRDAQPQNMWGGPLYPQSASWAEKYVGGPARQLAEATVPSAVSVLAPFTPEAAIPWLPSYAWRKMANAIRGRTPIGVDANEPPASRTLRATLSTIGINLYPEDLTNLESAVKKSIKK